MTPQGMRADARRNRARILEAAEQVFAEKGVSASTEEVAGRAGVAIGTVFRHFPTKEDLLRAIMKGLLERLADDVASLQADGDPATALLEFFSRVVEEAAAKKSVIELLAHAGIEVEAAGPLQALREAVEGLLTRAQQAGTVRGDVQISEVMALLTSTAQGALYSGWDPDLQRRTLAVIFDGLHASPRRSDQSR